MNPVTFNDIFLRFFKVPTESGKSNKLAAVQFASAPLFNCEMSEGIKGAENGEVHDLVFGADGRMLLPFPCIRAYLYPRKDAPGITHHHGGLKVVAFQGENPVGKPCTWVLIDMMTAGLPGSAGNGFLQCWYALGRRSKDGEKDVVDLEAGPSIFDSQKNFKEMTRIAMAMSQDSVKRISESLAGNFISFLYDVNSPANHIAKVSPDKPGKSVQWREARQHYVILDRRHEANSTQVKDGQALPHDETRNRERISHSRRAHWRTFRHERYRAAKGRRVRIKSMWIGPKVWRDLTGSTYQIIR